VKTTVQTPESSDDRLRFITYLNYISAIAKFLSEQYPEPSTLCRAVISSPAFNQIQGGKCSDSPKLQKLLRNSWFTEIQLNMASAYPDFIVYSNHWAPVQLYYAVYLSIRSFLLAGGHQAHGDHTSTLTAIAEQIRLRHDLFPQPWKTLCHGNPEDHACTYTGLPPSVTPQAISSLSSAHYVDFWNSYTMFLRTTRKRSLEKKCEDWKQKHKKKRVSPSAKKQFLNKLSPTSIFDGMYRLRIRSNYADVDAFLLTLDMDTEAKLLNEAIRTIGWYSALLFELLTARYLGKSQFRNIVQGFTQHDKEGRSATLLSARWKAIEQAWK